MNIQNMLRVQRAPRALASVVDLATRSDSVVLITGPTGCGKTTLAQKIHRTSRRNRGPFVNVNLASLFSGTLEAELFGHEAGAFTGAQKRRVGRLQFANSGTVFLDEVGELPLESQARLLDFIQTKKVSPLGRNEEIELDVRIIAATNRDLSALVKAGKFREDLFHRLRVVEIKLPSLSECVESYDEIIHGMIDEISLKIGKKVLRMSEEVALLIEKYTWPGNYRELYNLLEFAIYSTDSDVLELRHLPEWFFESFEQLNTRGINAGAALGVIEVPLSLDYSETLARFEHDYLQRAFNRFQGRLSLTARELGVNKTTLLRRLRAHGLVPEGRGFSESDDQNAPDASQKTDPDPQKNK